MDRLSILKKLLATQYNVSFSKNTNKRRMKNKESTADLEKDFCQTLIGILGLDMNN
jgi:hypothetical protein